ncbi:DUF819 family protein [Candidatus Sumerlaeota bacterium]|nr:DUF819 family protein [Candidatus Sumerlaeota bacterium]
MINSYLESNPMGVFTLLVMIVAGIYFAAEIKGIKRIFNVLPCVFWVYFIPMVFATIGIFPKKSPVYSLLTDFALPASLFLLFISVSIPDIIKLGPRALGMMLFGSVGIVLGGVLGMLALKPFFMMNLLPESHAPVLWKGVAALSGSWIGGNANMAAVWESVASKPQTAIESEIYSAMIAVDVIVAYGWMAIVIALSSFQKKFDAWNKADTRMIEEVNLRMKDIQEKGSKRLKTDKFLYMLALSLFVTLLCSYISVKAESGLKAIITSKTILSVVGSYTILIILVTLVGIGLSFTRARNLEDYGASRVGYALLYLVLARIGAKANLNAIGNFPLYLVMGVIWIGVHAVFLIIGARLLRAPMFFAATASQANIGGTVSAPVVAAAYQPNLAVVGLLMAVVGNIIGTFLALFGTGLFAQLLFGG